MGKKKAFKKQNSTLNREEAEMRCVECGSGINDFGLCDGCGRALDADELTENIAPANGDGESEFAVQFASPTLCVVVGPAKREYHLHKKALISKSPYFSTLLSSSFAGVEATSGTVTLNSEVDTDEAFQMFVEYLYHSDYSPPKGVGGDVCCSLHIGVYVLAERLCVDNLKRLALEKMVEALAEAAQLYPDTIAQLAEILYENTPDLYPQSNDDDQESPSGYRESQPRDKESLSGIGLNGTESGNEPKRRDKMRTLIARYAASRLDRMRQDSDFMETVRARGEFAEDLILAATNGNWMGPDQLHWL